MTARGKCIVIGSCKPPSAFPRYGNGAYSYAFRIDVNLSPECGVWATYCWQTVAGHSQRRGMVGMHDRQELASGAHPTQRAGDSQLGQHEPAD